MDVRSLSNALRGRCPLMKGSNRLKSVTETPSSGSSHRCIQKFTIEMILSLIHLHHPLCIILRVCEWSLRGHEGRRRRRGTLPEGSRMARKWRSHVGLELARHHESSAGRTISGVARMMAGGTTKVSRVMRGRQCRGSLCTLLRWKVLQNS